MMLGEEPSFFSSAYSMSTAADNRLVAIDEKIGRLHEFSLEPFALTASWELPFNTKGQTVIGSSDGTFNVVISGADWAVVRRDGSASVNPVELPSAIASWAWDQTTSTLALSDDRGSIALIGLAKDGTIQMSWLSGPLIAGENAIVTAGALLAGGTLVLATDSGKLKLIDSRRTMETQSIQAQDLEIEGITNIKWLAAYNAVPGVVISQSSARLSLVDTRNGSVTDEISMTDYEVVGNYREREPHIILNDLTASTTSSVLITASSDLKFVKTKISAFNADLKSSWLDQGVLTTMQENGFVESMRISDSLLMGTFEAVSDGQIAVTSQWMVLQYPSALGSMERRGYQRTSETQRIQGYNLPWVEKRRQ